MSNYLFPSERYKNPNVVVSEPIVPDGNIKGGVDHFSKALSNAWDRVLLSEVQPITVRKWLEVATTENFFRCVNPNNPDTLPDTLPESFSYASAVNWEAALGWHNSGYARVLLGHKLAAELLTTVVTEEAAGALHTPWKCFFITIPKGVVCYDANDTAWDILVYQSHINKFQVAWRTEFGILDTPFIIRDLKELVHFRDDIDVTTPGFPFAKQTQLMAGLVLSTIAEIQRHRQTVPGWGVIASDPAKQNRDQPINNFQLSRPVKIDLREHVRNWSRGSGRKLQLQSLVRGHYMMQAHGPGKSLRKLIYREPFWRGPKDAPVAIRPHLLGEQ